MSGLYLHVPFCRQKCSYCGFYSLAGHESTTGDQDHFISALACEWRHQPPGHNFRSLYLGGGTPTALGPDRLARLLRLLQDTTRPDPDIEWTCEANPESVTPEIAETLTAGGVNRISLGIQSLDVNALRWLGRVHTPRQARKAVAMLRDAGCANLGIDLMFGLPGTTRADTRRTLTEALALEPDHVSCYLLTVEADTPLAATCIPHRDRWIRDEDCAAQYQSLRTGLRSRGFHHYEISNFSRPGFECRHNLLYWTAGDYLGCGPAAHSHRRGTREALVADWPQWLAAARQGQRAVAWRERLPAEAWARETLVMGLRLCDGIDLEAFHNHTGYDALALCAGAGPFFDDGLLVVKEGRLRLAARAYFISDSVFRELV